MRVRAARASDMGDVYSIDDALFGSEIETPFRPDAQWWVAVVDHVVAGYAGAWVWDRYDESAFVFHRAGVLTAHRGLGIQRKLIRARVRRARALGLRECWTYTATDAITSANNLIACGFRLWSPRLWDGAVPHQRNGWIYWRLVL